MTPPDAATEVQWAPSEALRTDASNLGTDRGITLAALLVPLQHNPTGIHRSGHAEPHT